METSFLMLILILIVSVCIGNDTGVYASPTEAERLFNHLQQERHWKMPWFEGVNGELFIADDNSSAAANGAAAQLEMISPFLACAYGNKLHSFLLLTFVAISECDKMLREDGDHTDDCEGKLVESMERGRYVIFVLMGTLQYIDSAIGKDNADNPFYQVLMPLQSFLVGDVPVVFSADEPGGLILYSLFSRVADALGTYLFSTCLPPNQLFNLRPTVNEYCLQDYPSGLYGFYLIKLYSYVNYINDHLFQLGFYYDKTKNRIVFEPSLSG